MCIIGIFLIASASASDLNETTLSEIDENVISVDEIDDNSNESISNVVEGDKLGASEDLEVLSTNYTPKTHGEIQTAVESATDGDTIILDGYYVFEGNIKINKQLNFVGKNNATLDGTYLLLHNGNYYSVQSPFFIVNSTGVTFKNINFVNGSYAIHGKSEVVNCSFLGNSAGSSSSLSKGILQDCDAVNCTFKGNHVWNKGGAMYGGSAVNCTFINNYATGDGGALYNCSAIGCTFIGNSAENGGAMYGGSAIRCTFINNSVSKKSYGYGFSSLSGGALCECSAVNCTFINNTASEGSVVYGGAVYGHEDIINCIFINNRAYEASNTGGGAVCGYGNVVNCTFINNSAIRGAGSGGSSDGGAVCGECIVINSTFINNTAECGGGALSGGSAVNCTFINNYANSALPGYIPSQYILQRGGGAIKGGSAVNCSFVNNSAKVSGGAILSGSAINCNFSGNLASNGGAVYYSSVMNASFVGNSADSGGAMVGGSAVNCSFVSNSATEGGAMSGGSVLDCNFSENFAKNGGAVSNGDIINCSFVNNSAAIAGGATFDSHIYNSLFENNSASNGGAVFNSYVYNSLFENNIAFNDGGAIREGIVSNCTFNNNTANGLGGAVYNAVVTLDSTFNNNKASNGNDTYGVIFSSISSFDDLNALINNCNDTDIYLNKIYLFNTDSDSDFNEGINISRAVTIHGNGFVIDADKNARIFNVLNNDVIFENLKFRNGYTTGSGAAIYGNCTVINCTFINNVINNVADGYSSSGGAICGNCKVIDSTFIGNGDNSYSGSGGAMCGGYAENCIFIDNYASGTYDSYGGALYNCIAINCTFINNSAEQGGAISGSSAINCTFINNSAWSGGAISGSSAINCTFIGNHATGNGGAMKEGLAINCTFVNNSATDGGAMYGGQVINSIFKNNSASSGGALYMSACSESEFYNNSATENGGSIFGGRLTNSILIANSAINGGAMFGGIATNCTFNNNFADEYGGAVCNASVSTDSTFNNNKAGIGDDTFNVTFFSSGKDFKDLNLLINNNNNSEVYLDQNYTYEGFDLSFVEGITINRTVTIYGNGFTIDGGNYVRIFKVLNSNVVFRDIIFINADMSGYGGAVYGNCTVINCSFVNNSAEYGGAVYGNCTVINCSFVNNSAEYGGAVYGKCSVINCSFGGNSAYDGGAVYGKCSVINCSFGGNSATGSWHSSGGALYGGSAVNCSFVGNSAYDGGAVYFDEYGFAVNCSFVGNSADGDGGAMVGGSAVNCSFVGNSATGTWHSGGGALYGGSAVNCSFVNNSASTNGGAVYFDEYGFAVNCSFVNNSAHGDDGGAMVGGSAVNCSFINNSAYRSGGAMVGGSAVNCKFIHNYGHGSLTTGGAIRDGSAENCQFIDNSAYAGGAIYNGNAVNCSFVGNYIYTRNSWTSGFENAGGAIYNSHVSNCEFTGNSAPIAGAMYGGSAVNSTFVNNTATHGDSVENGIVTDCIFDVLPKNAIYHYTSFLKVNNLSMTLGEEEYLIANLSNVQGPIVNRTIIFTINGHNYNATTNDMGLASLNINDIIFESGTFNVFVSFDGNGVNYPASANVVVSVKSIPTLNVNDLSIFMEDSGFLIANLSDVSGQLFSKIITFSVNDKEYNVTTGFDGLAKLNIKNLLNESGSYNVNVTFEGDDFTAPASTISQVIIKKYDTLLKVDDLNIKIDENGIMIAKLYDSRGQLSGKNVSFKIRGKTYTAKTNPDGLAKLDISSILTEADDYVATVSYDGDDYNNPVSNNSHIIISKYDTVLEIKDLSIVLGDEGFLIANLSDIKGPLSGKTVIFAAGSNIYTNKTDVNGLARFNIKGIFTELGSYQVGVSFVEDALNNPVSSRANVFVNCNIYNLIISQEGKYYGNSNLTFKLVDSKTNASISGVQITLMFSNNATAVRTTDSDGKFIYEVPFAPGDYDVAAGLSLPDVGIETVGLTSFEISKIIGEIDVVQDENCRVLNIRVYNLNTGEAYGNINVSLDFEPNGEHFNLTTDEYGTATFNMDFDFGTYSVVAGISGDYMEFDNVRLDDIVINNNSNSRIITQNSLEADYDSVGSMGVFVIGGDLSRENMYIAECPDANLTLSGTVITISDLNAGRYTLCIRSSPDANHNAVTRSIPIIVKKVNSTISVPNIVFSYGDVGYADVNISGGNLSLENIHVVGHDEAVIGINGTRITVSNLSAGTYNLSVTTSPDSNHESATCIAQITVNKIDSVIDIDEITFDYGGWGYSNLTVIGGTVSVENIHVKGQDPLIRIGDNRISVSGLDAGNYTLTVISKEDDNHNSITRSVGVRVNEIDSNLDLYPVSGNYGDSSSTIFKVKDCSVLEENIFVVGHPEAIIKLEGDRIIVSNLTAGDYILNVTSTPDENYKAVTVSAKIIVNRIDCVVMFSDDIVFDYLGFNTTILTVDGGNVSDENIKVVGHSEAIIDYRGNKITVSNLTAGTYTLRVITTPDGNHKSVVAEAKVIVNKIDSQLNYTNDIVFDEGETGYTDVAVIGGSVLEGNIEVLGHSEAIVNITENRISVSNLTDGSYILCVSTTPDENHNSVEVFIDVTVRNIPSAVGFSTRDIVFDYGGVGSTQISVVGGYVSPSDFKVNGSSKVNITMDSNNYVYVRDLDAGNYILEVTTNPDENHRSVVAYLNITVKKIASKIKCGAITFDYGKNGVANVVIDGGTVNASGTGIDGHPGAVSVNGNRITISGLNADKYSLHISSVPDKNHYAVSANVLVTVKKVKSTVSLSNIVFNYHGSGSTFVVVKGGSVGKVSIDGSPKGAKRTLKNNVVRVSGLNAGTYKLRVKSNPDKNHLAGEGVATIKVNKIASTISFSSKKIVFDYLKSGSTTVAVVGGKILKSGLKVVGSKAKLNIKKNKITVSGLKVGTYKLRVADTPNRNYKSDVKFIKIKVNMVSAAIKVKKMSIYQKDSKKWTIKVIDKKTKKGIKSIVVKLKIFTGKKSKIFKVKTNSKGIASFKASNKLYAGKHKVVLTMNKYGYKCKSVTSSITIKKLVYLKFKYKADNFPDGSSVKVYVKNKAIHKPINGVALRLNVYYGKKIIKNLKLVTGNYKDSDGKLHKGFVSYVTNKIPAGKHKLEFKPISPKYKGSLVVNKFVIAKGAAKHRKISLYVSNGKTYNC